MTLEKMILLGPIKTEKAIGKIERDNSVIFRVAQSADKKTIKKAVEEMFGTRVASVRTYITKKEKRAIVKFAKGVNAEEEIVNKLKLAV
jgi:ribosomal protein L23